MFNCACLNAAWCPSYLTMSVSSTPGKGHVSVLTILQGTVALFYPSLEQVDGGLMAVPSFSEDHDPVM